MERIFRGERRRMGNASRVGLAAAAAALAGGAGFIVYDNLDVDIVRRGDNGTNYLLPERSERPVYATRQDCVDDVQENIEEYKEETGRDIPQTAEELCEPASRIKIKIDLSRSQSDGADDRYAGPVIDGDERWKSPRVKQWAVLGNEGGFAPPGGAVQSDLALAPPGSKPGQIIRYGFGGRDGAGS